MLQLFDLMSLARDYSSSAGQFPALSAIILYDQVPHDDVMTLKRIRNYWAAKMMTSSNGNTFRVTGRCAGNSPVTGELPGQRSVTRSFDVFSNLRQNKRLSKPWQSRGWWLETPSCPLWRHCNDWNAFGITGLPQLGSYTKRPVMRSFDAFFVA